MNLSWLADAAGTAAERGLGALYSLLYVSDAAGELEGVRPASSASVRSLVKLNQDLGTNLTTLKFNPAALLAVSNALRDGHAISVRELGHALPLEMEAAALQTAQRSLGVAKVWLAPLHWDGESLGLLMLLMQEETPAPLALAEQLGYQVAVALRNLREKESVRRRGEIDAVRWVYDQQRFEEQLSLEIHRAHRHKRPLSIMLLRVDNFRDLRERFGRFLADRLLRQIGGVLETTMRDTDFLGAYQDDGFAAILIEADAGAAALALTRLTAGLKDVQVPNAELDDLHVNLSCTTATAPADGDTQEELLFKAEERLAAEAATREDAAASASA
jgi:diguanylate cyclase (GGDEF)-like protein